jgi:transcriptional regulator with XRE-family HTH domain
MKQMRPVIAESTTPESRRAARHLANLVREARLARRMPQAELAARARTSRPTIDRIEKGGVETALGTWLAVMEQVGLLGQILGMTDPISPAIAEDQRARRARRNTPKDLDF